MQSIRHIGGLLAVVALLPTAAEVHGQYAPYAPQQFTQQQTNPQHQGTPGYGQAAPGYGRPAASSAQQPTGYGQPAQAYGQAQQGYGYNPRGAYGAPPAQPRYAMAAQNAEPTLNTPAENVPPGAPQAAQPVAPQFTPQPAPSQSYAPGPAPAVTQNYGGYMPAAPAAQAGGDCNCQNQTAAPAPMGYESYPAAGCSTGACGDGGYAGYGGGGYDTCGTYSTYGCGLNQGRGARLGGLMPNRSCNYWFGGVYGLFMERDSGDKVPLAFAASGLTPGDYPGSNSVVLTTRNVGIGFQPGVEFRLGRTFGGHYDPCSCSCTTPCWGIEAVYWTLFEDDAFAQYVDSATLRTYSMIDPRGLEYDPGTGYRPLRDYLDYAPPVEDHTTGGDIRIDLARVRSSFEVQNLEINLLRLPLMGGGAAACGVAAAGGGCDSGCSPCGGRSTGCDACGTASCGGGCGCGSRFSVVTLCGFRYMQFDESFMYGVNFTNTTSSATGFMDYHSQVSNDLYGFQLGSNGMYRIGCKWGVHLGANFGLYGNDIDVHQYFNSPTGNVRFIQTGENFDARASKTDVAMIGELRLGASYQYSCKCRLYGGWRAIGVTGIALATDQVPNAFIDAAQLASYVNSNGSMILHGLQTGVEWNY